MKNILIEIFNKKNNEPYGIQKSSEILKKYSSLDENRILKDYFVESKIYDTKTQVTEIVLVSKYIDEIEKNKEILNIEFFLENHGFETLGRTKNNNLIMIEDDFVADISSEFEKVISISFYMKDRNGLYYEYKNGEYL